MKKLLLIGGLILGLSSCKKENCGPCTTSLNGVIQPILTSTICTDEQELLKRKANEDFNALYGTNNVVLCDR
jgi:hypothetical protein